MSVFCYFVLKRKITHFTAYFYLSIFILLSLYPLTQAHFVSIRYRSLANARLHNPTFFFPLQTYSALLFLCAFGQFLKISNMDDLFVGVFVDVEGTMFDNGGKLLKCWVIHGNYMENYNILIFNIH